MKLLALIRKEFLQLVFIFCTFGLMVGVSYYFVSQLVEREMLYNAREALFKADMTVTAELQDAEKILLTAETFIKKGLDRGEPIEQIASYLIQITDFMNSGNIEIPGYLYVYGYVQGYFITGNEEESVTDYDPRGADWYIVAEAAGGATGITLPHTDIHSGKRVISLAKIIRDSNGVRHGAIAVDLDFSTLSDYIATLRFAEGGYGMLCDKDLIFIVHPFGEFVDRPMFEVTADYERAARTLLEDPRLFSAQRILNRVGIRVVLTFWKMDIGWYLGVATPVTSFYRDKTFMALMLSGMGFVSMVILSFLLIRLAAARERSNQENMEKTSFLARMSHEIRTPMNSILGVAEIIHRKQLPDEVQDYIEIIRQNGNNLMAIINDVLDFSKIESGRFEVENRDYYIASVINDIVNMIRPRVAEKSLNFFVYVDSAIPARLFGDDMRLRQILTNLLTNAVKYTRHGFISLDVGMERLEEGSLKLICSVHDSGIGIKPEDQKRLFAEFSRIDRKVNQGIEGTGLGLVITRALCRTLGGDVTVSSEYGKGSVFRAVVVQKFEYEKPAAQVIYAEKKRVLFYDWRIDNIQAAAKAFKNLGISFECSVSLEDLISRIEQGPYDYVFVSSKYAMDCIPALGKRSTPLQLVIMVEPGEMSVYQGAVSVFMPVYSITLANILNDVSRETTHQGRKDKISFTAPSAKILIVDDILTNLRVAKELMIPYKMSIHICMSGPEAVNMVQDTRYDLVFMDHMMPGMDGVEATGLIRSIESDDGYYRDLPIIALTANALSDQQKMFLQQGLNDFLAKPIDIYKLNAILEKWLPEEKRVDLEPSKKEPQYEKAEPEKAELVIPGVDVEMGLHNSGGTEAIYLNILEDFCQDVETRLVQIIEALKKDDVKLYTTLVHAIKGAARSIGAVETGETAAWLESMAGKDFEAARAKTVELEENIRPLLNNIRIAAARNKAEHRQDQVAIPLLHLETLKKALMEMDIEEVNKILLDYASLPLDEETKDIITEIEQNVLIFEYDKAIETINKRG